MYIRTYVAVTLRNVNLRSCLGMSICAHTQESGVTETCITCMRMLMEDGEDSAGGPLQRTYLAESSAETSAECSRWLASLRESGYVRLAKSKEVSPP